MTLARLLPKELVPFTQVSLLPNMTSADAALQFPTSVHNTLTWNVREAYYKLLEALV